MNAQHKDILRVNRSNLVDNIQDVKSVVNKLYEKKTITNPMVEQILEGNQTKTDQKRALLDMIPRRGPNAFVEFLNVLIECQEWDAAEFLKPGAGRTAEQTHKFTSQSVHPQSTPHIPIISSPIEDDLPRFWPDANYNPLDVNVRWVDSADHNMRSKFERSCITGSPFYCLQSSKRGKVLIINNEDFSIARKMKGLKLDDRVGTDMDATSLDILFDKLFFKVITSRNLNAQSVRSALTDVSREDHTNYDCFICVFLSHGTGGGIFGTDGEVVKIQDLTDLFNGQNCPTLARKPKLFFVQACQGNKVDTGTAGAPISLPTSVPSSSPSSSEPDQEEEISLKKVSKAQDDVLHKLKNLNMSDTQSDAIGEENVPTRADTFVAFATTPDYLSYRNTSRGTWFVQAITYIFQTYAHAEDLNSMMTKVNDLVSRGEIMGRGHKQVSKFDSSFRKKFYFFPGLLLSPTGQTQHYNQMQSSS